MAHFLADRSGDAGDIGRHRFRHVGLDEFRRLFLGRAANFADHDDRLGFRVGLEHCEDIDERSAGNRIATDTNARGHTNSQLLEFVERLIGEST